MCQCRQLLFLLNSQRKVIQSVQMNWWRWRREISRCTLEPLMQMKGVRLRLRGLCTVMCNTMALIWSLNEVCAKCVCLHVRLWESVSNTCGVTLSLRKVSWEQGKMIQHRPFCDWGIYSTDTGTTAGLMISPGWTTERNKDKEARLADRGSNRLGFSSGRQRDWPHVHSDKSHEKGLWMAEVVLWNIVTHRKSCFTLDISFFNECSYSLMSSWGETCDELHYSN